MYNTDMRQKWDRHPLSKSQGFVSNFPTCQGNLPSELSEILPFVKTPAIYFSELQEWVRKVNLGVVRVPWSQNKPGNLCTSFFSLLVAHHDLLRLEK